MTSKDFDSLAHTLVYAGGFNTLLFAAMTMRSDPDMSAGRALLAVGFPLAMATTVFAGFVILAAAFGYELYTLHDAKKESPDAR